MIKGIYDIFANNWYHNGSIWIISDPHFNDPEMPSLRKNYIGDEALVKRINSKVNRNDTLIILGDIGDIKFIERLHGYKVLIMGNHDAGASNYKRIIKSETRLFVMPQNKELPYTPEQYDQLKRVRKKVMKDYPDCTHVQSRLVKLDNHLFDEVYEGPLTVSDRLILSHEPIDKLGSYMFNIHGHDHSKRYTSPHHLNVCAEHIDYTPVNLTKLLREGLLKDIQSIHRVTIDTAIERKAKRQK